MSKTYTKLLKFSLLPPTFANANFFSLSINFSKSSLSLFKLKSSYLLEKAKNISFCFFWFSSNLFKSRSSFLNIFKYLLKDNFIIIVFIKSVKGFLYEITLAYKKSSLNVGTSEKTSHSRIFSPGSSSVCFFNLLILIINNPTTHTYTIEKIYMAYSPFNENLGVVYVCDAL